MNFFVVVDVGPTLGSEIPVTSKHHSQYINAATSSLEQTEEEFKTAYFSLKRNKSLGYDEFRANVGKSVYNEMQKHFFYISQQSFNEDVFPWKLKIANVTPIFKKANQ